MNGTLDKINKREQSAMYKIITKDYSTTTENIERELAKIYAATKYDKEGNITNERKINKMIKRITPLIILLWGRNGAHTLDTGAALINTTYLYNEYVVAVKLGNSKVFLSKDAIDKAVKNTINKRKRIIKWDKVIKGNTKLLDKRVAKVIKKGLAKGNTEKQIQNKLVKTMKINSGKAKAIARTETNTYRSDSKLQVGELNNKNGTPTMKMWVYTFASVESRPEHLAADGQTVKMDEYFNIGGKKTKAPQHFGEAGEDINCSCDMSLVYEKTVATSVTGFNKYKEVK